MSRHPKNEWRKARRKGFLEDKDSIFYIFCEGEKTEPNYFNAFKEIIEENPLYRNSVVVKIKGVGKNTVTLLQEAKKYIRNNDIAKGDVYCVYDKDDFPDDDFDNLPKQMDKLNKNSNVKYHACWSNECIEIWFLLHFMKYTSNNGRQQYLTKLNQEFSKHGIKKYQKNMEDIFTVLEKYGNPKKAIKYAKEMTEVKDGSAPSKIVPGTKVYELVELLAKYLPEDERKMYLQS